MTRLALVAALLTANITLAVDEAPPPRLKGVPFVPPKSEAKAEDPAETVGKIIKNAKEVTDRLAKSDTGTDTRKTQDDTLALIDALLNRQDDPPPQGDMSDDKKPKDEQDKKDKKDMTSDPMPKEGGGKDQSKSNRRPRNPGGQESKGGKEPMGMEPGGMPPEGGKEGGKEPMGMEPGAGSFGGNPIPKQKPTLPVDDDVAKDVWGHLPDHLRKQVATYYKEEFMPRYAELLKQYYSSLSDKGAKPEKK